jgi:hypothetical protein
VLIISSLAFTLNGSSDLPLHMNADMKVVLFGMLILLLPIIATAQSEYRAGYLISTGTDTIKGYVRYRLDSKRYEACTFKRSGSDKEITYGPSEINGYGYEGDAYFRSVTLEKEGIQQRLFIEVLVQGNLNLYKDQQNFWVAKGDSVFHRLYIEERLLETEGRKKIMKSNHHAGIINYLTSDCPKNIKSGRSVRLVEKPLTKLVEAYNDCMTYGSVSPKAAKPWLKVTVGAGAGLVVSQVYFDVPYYQNSSALVPGAVYTRSATPSANVLFELSAPRIDERVSFYGGALFSSSNHTSYSEFSWPYVVQRHYTSIEAQKVSLPFGFKYLFSGSGLQPYVMAGGSYAHLLRGNALKKVEEESEWHGDVQVTEHVPFAFTSKQYGFWGGLGVEKQFRSSFRLFAELRVERSSGLAIQHDHRYSKASRIDQVSLMAGIKF